jgi:predicted transglutaminase-like cysteine proteinase
MISSKSRLVALVLAIASMAAPGASAARGHAGEALFQPRETALLQLVNEAVNASHRPGQPLPSDPDGVWDCDNYALGKYRSLRDDFGWPQERLALGLVRLPDGEAHMVVLVRGQRDWAVLDNLTSEIVPLEARRKARWVVKAAGFEPARAPSAAWVVAPRAVPAAWVG